jgi:hypothetical protein
MLQRKTIVRVIKKTKPVKAGLQIFPENICILKNYPYICRVNYAFGVILHAPPG